MQIPLYGIGQREHFTRSLARIEHDPKAKDKRPRLRFLVIDASRLQSIELKRQLESSLKIANGFTNFKEFTAFLSILR